MRLSEVFLRIGSTLAAWMVIYAYFIWLAVVQRVECGVDGDEIYRLMLGMAPFAVGASFLLGASRPFPDIHRMLRWLGLPIAGLLLLAAPVIWQTLVVVNLEGGAICDGVPKSGWQHYWAPVQLIATGLCIWKLLTVWRPATIKEKDAVATDS